VNNQPFGSYDQHNRLLSLTSNTDPQWAPTYDGEGNLLRIKGADAVESVFEWNKYNKLQAVVALGQREEYLYDTHAGLRTYKKAASGEETVYFYDGYQLLGELKIDGTAKRVYTWGVTGLVSQRSLVTTTPTTVYYHAGYQGEIRMLTNSAGVRVGSYRYTAYGKEVEAVVNAGIENPFRYAGAVGCMTESVSKLVLCGQRWYHPGLKRWLSRDPIGYDGGFNQYEYVINNPINFIDRNGLNPLLVWTRPAPVIRFPAPPRLWGRGDNHLRPDPDAIGEHTTFRWDSCRRVTHYQEWKNNPYPRYPSKWISGKRFDPKGSRPHTNKVTRERIPAPHVHDPETPGEVRLPKPDEIPGGHETTSWLGGLADWLSNDEGPALTLPNDLYA
jgi:RHS repeat-associated protein